jgi:predicted kinase
MLIVFSGLPGTGKTTLARALAARRGAVYLRIDVIEQALRNAGMGDVGAAGYGVAQALAESNLALGRAVVADCVNPVAESRAGWHAVARRAECAVLDVEVVCSDPAEHRRRVEGRESDIPGLVPPTWLSVARHEYETWATARLVVNTAALSPNAAVALIEARIAQIWP